MQRPPRSWLVLTRVVAAAVALFLTLSAAPARATDRIAWVDPLRGRLRTMNPDGSDPRTIFRVWHANELGGEHVDDPAWSPDRRWVAVTWVRREERRPLQMRITLVRANGGRAVPLVVGREPTWSPDGSTLAFARGSGPDPGRVLLVDADGSDVRLIARFTYPVMDLRWSPAGGQILVESGFAIWSMGEDGSDLHQILSESSSPSFTPDGGQIYSIGLMTSDGGDCGPIVAPVLQRSDANGGGLTPLLVPGAYEGVSAVDVSPDGASLALMVRRLVGQDPSGCEDYFASKLATIDVGLSGPLVPLGRRWPPAWCKG